MIFISYWYGNNGMHSLISFKITIELNDTSRPINGPNSGDNSKDMLEITSSCTLQSRLRPKRFLSVQSIEKQLYRKRMFADDVCRWYLQMMKRCKMESKWSWDNNPKNFMQLVLRHCYKGKCIDIDVV